MDAALFRFPSKSSIAEGAVLELTRIPIKMRCDGCRAEFKPNMKEETKIVCPECGSAKHEMIEGTGYFLTGLEVV